MQPIQLNCSHRYYYHPHGILITGIFLLITIFLTTSTSSTLLLIGNEIWQNIWDNNVDSAIDTALHPHISIIQLIILPQVVI